MMRRVSLSSIGKRYEGAGVQGSGFGVQEKKEKNR